MAPALPAAHIAAYAAGAGFRGDDLIKAVAVTFPESSGVPSAHTLTGREDSRGLWQINVRAHPQWAGADLYDPATNARAAYAVYGEAGRSFRPWTGYTSGAWLLYRPAAAAAVGHMTPVSSAGVVPAATAAGTPGAAQAEETGWTFVPGVPVPIPLPGDTGLGDIVGLLKAAIVMPIRAAAWMSNQQNWVRVGQVVIGAGLVLGGAAVVARTVQENAVAGVVNKAIKGVGK